MAAMGSLATIVSVETVVVHRFLQTFHPVLGVISLIFILIVNTQIIRALALVPLSVHLALLRQPVRCCTLYIQCFFDGR
jgi:hypothetical protein